MLAGALILVATVIYRLVEGWSLLDSAYFSVVTSLSTILQQHLEDHVRGRIMALWIMGFGGTVPIGTLAAGPIADHTSITVVVLLGAAAALLLAWYAEFD